MINHNQCPRCNKNLTFKDIYIDGPEWDHGSVKYYEGTEETCVCGYNKWIDWTDM